MGHINSHCSGDERAQTRSSLLLYTPLLYCPLAFRSAHVISCCLSQAIRKQHQEAMILKKVDRLIALLYFTRLILALRPG